MNFQNLYLARKLSHVLFVLFTAATSMFVLLVSFVYLPYAMTDELVELVGDDLFAAVFPEERLELEVFVYCNYDSILFIFFPFTFGLVVA